MRPPQHVVEAFGGEPAQLTPLSGGQGRSWRAGEIVVKPADPGEPIAWLAELCARLTDSDDFRLGRWVSTVDGHWSVDGWSATRWLPGEHRSGRWKERLATAAAFHAALAELTLPPNALDELAAWDDPWSIGMRVAWGRQEHVTHLPPDAVRALDVLDPLLVEPWTGRPAQLIHGDLAGNMLYADGLPPAIIDMSPHLAPAPFAEATIVADAVAWDGAPESFATWYVDTHPAARQLLARAVVFRLVSAAVLWPDSPERVAVDVRAYRPIIVLCQASSR